ncbi:hypothetical protein FRB97_006794 [Tulasnella sp. 331]|nr:hypothetical protein FRB97_006794 [Tulasnella sp. 331]
MNDSSTTNWEAGTRAETILEIDFPELTVFSPAYLSLVAPPYTVTTLQPVLSIVQTAVNNRTNASSQLWGPDASAGDPASLGAAVLLGSRIYAANTEEASAYAQAAQTQLDLILNGTPRVESGLAAGAISHRVGSVGLWSDFIYMVPPFLAYYGAMTNNLSLILESYNQISLYRSALLSSNVSLWQHIYCPGAYSPITNNFNDTGHFGLGNGWAAAGMLRVLATMKNSPWSLSDFQEQQSDLSSWITEIHMGMTNNLPASGIFNNYVDLANNVSVPSFEGAINFPDGSGTALFAGTVYRHVTLANPKNYDKIIAAAETARVALYTRYGAAHFDVNGWLKPVVDPNAFAQQGNQSAEAQSFVLQLDNNWKAWVTATNGASDGRRGVVRDAISSKISVVVFCAVIIPWI